MLRFFATNWEIILGMIGTFGAWFGGQKLMRQNEKTTELNNLKTVREVEKSLLTDMKEQVSQLIEGNNYLRKVVIEQEKTINKYKTKYGELL